MQNYTMLQTIKVDNGPDLRQSIVFFKILETFSIHKVHTHLDIL